MSYGIPDKKLIVGKYYPTTAASDGWVTAANLGLWSRQAHSAFGYQGGVMVWEWSTYSPTWLAGVYTSGTSNPSLPSGGTTGATGGGTTGGTSGATGGTTGIRSSTATPRPVSSTGGATGGTTGATGGGDGGTSSGTISSVTMTLSWATIYTITWKQVSAGTVRILIVDSNNAAQVTIPSIDGIAGANTYLWTVPNSARIASGSYKTRVQSTVTTSQSADSSSYSIVACTFNPCRVSGSTCSNPSGKCTCPSGVAASVCNPVTTDPCASVSCKNSGTCSDGTCVCTTGWTGSDCSTATTSCSLTCLNGGVADSGCKTCQCSLLYAGTNCEYMQLCLSAKLNIQYTVLSANAATYAKNFKNDIAKAISITPAQVTSVTFTAASDGLTTVNFCLTGSTASSSLELAASLNTIMSNPSSTLAQGDVTSSTEGGFEAVDQLGTSAGKSWLDKVN
jgi:hypothetical protein